MQTKLNWFDRQMLAATFAEANAVPAPSANDQGALNWFDRIMLAVTFAEADAPLSGSHESKRKHT